MATKHAISLRALTQRINRKLSGKGQHLRKRGAVWFVTDGACIKNVDILGLAKDLGVMQAWERLET